MARAVGIDLGTTNSVVSVLEGGEPTVIANAEGSRTTPSVVAFSKTGEVLVGEIAKRQAVTNVDRTITSVKRHMGTDWSQAIDDKKYTAQEISARVLAKLKRDAEEYLGEPVTEAVITVPAYFNDAERQATKDAGADRGPQRPAHHQRAHRRRPRLRPGAGKEDELILVFDLGGGTFDVSLLEVGKDDDGFSTIQVRATSGDNRLGGDDWDQRIVEYLISEVKNSTGVDLAKDKIAVQRLREAAEQAKKELSSATSTNISLQYLSMSENGPVHLDSKLTRAQFQQMTQDLLDRTKAPFHVGHPRRGHQAVRDRPHRARRRLDPHARRHRGRQGAHRRQGAQQGRQPGRGRRRRCRAAGRRHEGRPQGRPAHRRHPAEPRHRDQGRRDDQAHRAQHGHPDQAVARSSRRPRTTSRPC